jgi:hypothetical protein
VKIIEALRQWLASGGERMGELFIFHRGDSFEVCHYRDSGAGRLTIYQQPEDARAIARYDALGKYRPLKSAPNLRPGWLLRVTGISDLRLALDFFYPAMPGSWADGAPRPVEFRETANRQSGMYAVVKKITNAEANSLIGGFCRSDGKCLKTILWRIDADSPIQSLPDSKFDLSIDQLTGAASNVIPLPCAEACHLLVAAAREVVKSATR